MDIKWSAMVVILIKLSQYFHASTLNLDLTTKEFSEDRTLREVFEEFVQTHQAELISIHRKKAMVQVETKQSAQKLCEGLDSWVPLIVNITII